MVRTYTFEDLKNSEEGKELKQTRNTKYLIIPIELQLELDENQKEIRENFIEFTFNKKN